MQKNSKIFVAGHLGLVGNAIKRTLEALNYNNLILRTSGELDLRRQDAVEEFFVQEKPEYVFLCAAKVGGIQANANYPVEFIMDNILIQTNVIKEAYRNNVKKLLLLGSSCIYPKFSHQPIKEEFLLDGALEPTNEFYAVAKIAGLKMCEAYNRQFKTNYIAVMPTNLYGPNDNFNLENSHVLPALIRKFYEAKFNRDDKVIVWGTGSAKREFLYVDDLAQACILLMEKYSWDDLGRSIVNIGIGDDISIYELAYLIKEIVDYEGDIVFDHQKPDGTPRKLLDVSKITKLGWQPKICLREGIEMTYQWYLENKSK